MIAAALRRIGWSVVVLWFVVTVTFAALYAIPDDPMRALLGPHATPEAVERVRAHYCLDDGLLGSYGCYLDALVHGDLGTSYRSQRPVASLIADRAWPTLQLALAAFALQLVLGIPLGLVAAMRRGRWADHASHVVVLLAQSAPAFVVGTVALYVFGYLLGWFPIAGYGVPGLDRLWHLVLPAATLATGSVAYYARVVRSELVEQLREDYIRTAHAKGLGERDVVLRHALRNALGPLVTLAGVDLGVLLGGAIVTEVVFAWPGLGREVVQSVAELDIPLILGVVLVSAVAITLANLLADLVHLWLDPRLREG